MQTLHVPFVNICQGIHKFYVEFGSEARGKKSELR